MWKRLYEPLKNSAHSARLAQNRALFARFGHFLGIKVPSLHPRYLETCNVRACLASSCVRSHNFKMHRTMLTIEQSPSTNGIHHSRDTILNYLILVLNPITFYIKSVMSLM